MRAFRLCLLWAFIVGTCWDGWRVASFTNNPFGAAFTAGDASTLVERSALRFEAVLASAIAAIWVITWAIAKFVETR